MSAPRLALAIAALLAAAPLAAQPADRAATVRRLDSVVTTAMAGGRVAGMTAAVVQGRDTLLLRGYGKADLELDVATPPRAVYEMGSLTKQFTAAAILRLQEEGKLSLDDELTTHLTTYPTQGHRVTLRRLLDHTSGIRSYTEIPEFGTIASRTLPRDSLVAAFAAKPFDFAPGEGLVYNNSAYFLLGLVIERVSGLPYERYVKEQLFDRAGLRDASYCSNTAVVPRRAHGYQHTPQGMRRADYIDHTWPYAAGSLCGSVEDMVTWTQALHGGRVLGAAAYRELVTPGTLNDGTPVRYAKGVVHDSIVGRRAIFHGGDIPGHATEADHYPDDSLTVVVFMNTQGPVRPSALTEQLARVVLGDRTPPPRRFAGRAADYAGTYRGPGRGTPLVLTVAAGDGGLTVSQNGRPAAPLLWLGGERFAVGAQRYTFVREGGRVVRVHADARFQHSVAARLPE